MELYKELVFYGSQTVQLSEVPPYQMSLNQQTNTGDVAEVHAVDTHSHTCTVCCIQQTADFF